MDRRAFLKWLGRAAMAGTYMAVGGGLGLPGMRAWAGGIQEGPNRKRLLVVFLRGAADGLSAVVPYGDADYYRSRTTIAIAPPGKQDGALDLDGYFGLHPSLGKLLPFWRENSLAFLNHFGSPDETRSHFDAQNYMESGTPGVKSTSEGWMNRLLGVLPGSDGRLFALSFGLTVPHIMAGDAPVTVVATGRAADRPLPVDRPLVRSLFDGLYDGDDLLSRAYHEGINTRQTLKEELAQEMAAANNGAPLPPGFPATAARIGTLLAADTGATIAFADIGGWDTHINQGGASGQLARHLAQLGEGLSVLKRELGPAYKHTLVLVMSEFGRTVRENGNRGTDHGHGNLLWLMGGGVRGGKIYGDWPGLAAGNLYQGRDLPVLHDFRTVIAGLLSSHLGLGPAAVRQVFTGTSGSGDWYGNMAKIS